MRSLPWILLFGAIGFGQQAEKPACNAKTHGEFWPSEANADQRAKREFTQEGVLEMCTSSGWRYRWNRVSVNIRDMGIKRHHGAAVAKAAARPSDTK